MPTSGSETRCIRPDFAALIAASHGPDESRRFTRFTPTSEVLRAVADVGREILQHVPSAPGACALMTAVWVTLVRDRTGLPVHHVAGNLAVDGERIYGCDSPAGEIAAAFDQSQLAWDGHCWLAIGQFVGDLSIFRTAYSSRSHPRLRRVVLEEFGPGRGLLLARSQSLAASGLLYEPNYVLSATQVDGLFLLDSARFWTRSPVTRLGPSGA